MQAVQPMTFRKDTAAADLSSGTETILLVDDEEPVQHLVRQILERRGYRILAASDGPAALRLSSDFQGDIHLVLTDIVMPGMSGLEVATCLLAARPSMKVLYMSGHPATVVSQQWRMPPRQYFIQKPFLVPALALKIREVLDDNPA